MSLQLKRNIAYSIFLVLFLQSVFGQTVTVLEEGSLTPIPGVALYNFKKNKTQVTDLNGKASLGIFDLNEIIFFQNFLYEKQKLTKAEIAKNNNIIYLVPKVEGLKQIVISASKFEQNKRDIPQTIVSIDAKDIALVNPQTSADLLENTGNIYIQKSQLGGGVQ